MPLSMEALALYTWLSLRADEKGNVMVSRALLCKQTGYSDRQVRTAIEKLVATKLVTKLSTKLPTKFATTLTISFLSNCECEKSSSDQVKDQVNVQVNDQVSRVNKNIDYISSHNNYDSKKKNNIPPLSPIGGNSYEWSMLSDEMKKLVMQWLEYKKEKKQTYKPTGFKTFCKRLIDLSGNDPVKARLIIEYSMSNNYSGIFELRSNYETTRINRCQQDYPTNDELKRQTIEFLASREAQRRACDK